MYQHEKLYASIHRSHTIAQPEFFNGNWRLASIRKCLSLRIGIFNEINS